MTVLSDGSMGCKIALPNAAFAGDSSGVAITKSNLSPRRSRDVDLPRVVGGNAHSIRNLDRVGMRKG